MALYASRVSGLIPERFVMLVHTSIHTYIPHTYTLTYAYIENWNCCVEQSTAVPSVFHVGTIQLFAEQLKWAGCYTFAVTGQVSQTIPGILL